MITTNDIIHFLECQFADISKQSKWDFSGKQVFTGNKEITKIALSLDPKYNIIEKAVKEGCGLLITHHPLFFHESKGIDVSNLNHKKAVAAIKGNLDILSYHTNIDIADDGTNDYICSLLEAEKENGFLSMEGSSEVYKFAVFTPYDYKDKVFSAVTKAGAGSLYSNYEACGFIAEGAGLFTPLENAKPFVGEIFEPQIVDEVKIETIVLKKDINNVIKAMREAHPYEEIAYDIIRLENSVSYGFGRTARLNKAYSLKEFISFVKDKLNITNINTNMEDTAPFDRIGICTGSAASLWKDALKKGVNVLLTGDMKYHDALDAYEHGICMIDAGHQGTEEIYMNYLSEILKKQFNIDVIVLKQETQIINWGGK